MVTSKSQYIETDYTGCSEQSGTPRQHLTSLNEEIYIHFINMLRGRLKR